MSTIPFGNPGVVGNGFSDFGHQVLLLSDTPVLFETAMQVAQNQTLALYEVVGLDPNGDLVPAVYGGPALPSTGALTFSGLAVADETVTIGTTVYTWKAAPAANYEVLIGADAAGCAANLIAAVNAAPVTVGANEYFDGTPAHPNVIASAGVSGVVELVAKVAGQPGDTIATTETLTNGAFGAATLGGGQGAGAKAVGVMAGAITTTGAEAMAPVLRGGHFNGDFLTWDASFDSDAKKKAAFEGANSPTQIVIGFNPFNRTA